MITYLVCLSAGTTAMVCSPTCGLVWTTAHISSTFGGAVDGGVRNWNNQVAVSGLYFYHIEATSGERRVGRMTIVNFAQSPIRRWAPSGRPPPYGGPRTYDQPI